jgi:hypothetical protein
MDDKRGCAVESGLAIELLASHSKALKFPLRPASRLFVLLFLLLPVLAKARNQLQSCGLAYQMQQTELPSDIAVRVDPMTSAVTKIAMDWWVGRLSTPTRPVTWHVVEDREDCMIYIRHGLSNIIFKPSTAGYTHMPDHERYDGVAIVMLINPWVVAHEIGHLIGCRHGGGVMRAEYTTGEKRLWIDDDALHFAVLVRAKASSWRSSLALVAKGQPADFRAADQR